MGGVEELGASALRLGTATLFEAAASPTSMMDPRIAAVWAGACVAGPAFPVECSPGDNLGIHLALEHAPAGSVLVVATGGFLAGYWGEVLTVAAEAAGVKGLVIDGGVRDVAALRRRKFPVFSPGISVRGTVKATASSVGKPIRCGGAPVAPGDFVVADDDGVVVLPKDRLQMIIASGEARARKEEQIMARLAQGATTVDLLGLSRFRAAGAPSRQVWPAKVQGEVSESEDRSLWLFGAGNMGGAMLRSWIANGIEPGRITVIDPLVKEVPEGVEQLTDIPAGRKLPDTLVLAVKPQHLSAVQAQLRSVAGTVRLVFSVLAGVETETLRRCIGGRFTVRAMPNLPVSVASGVIAVTSPDATAAVRAEVARLMRPLGLVEWIDDERKFNAVTALSGCGPGFVFRFIEAMAQAGAALGLESEQAMRLATATVAGSGILASRSGKSAGELANDVASPGGTTREGLNVLDRDLRLSSLMEETLRAAAERAAVLADAAREAMA